MKEHHTQKMFWKKWLYKAIIEIRPARQERSYGNHRFLFTKENHRERTLEINRIKAWCTNNFSGCGLRCEGNLTVFLNDPSQIDTLVDQWGPRILEVWRPANDQAVDLLLEHTHDIIREKPWYGKYPIRAKILYNSDFRENALDMFKTAVKGMDPDDWHASGQLAIIIRADTAAGWSWGQPLHLYLASADDAAMLRLQCGSYIERFERVRPPV